jgi:hypothetical protein
MAFEQFLPQPPNYSLTESTNFFMDLFGTNTPPLVEPSSAAEEGDACIIRNRPSAITRVDSVSRRGKVTKIHHYLYLSPPDEFGRQYITPESGVLS